MRANTTIRNRRIFSVAWDHSESKPCTAICPLPTRWKKMRLNRMAKRATITRITRNTRFGMNAMSPGAVFDSGRRSIPARFWPNPRVQGNRRRT